MLKRALLLAGLASAALLAPVATATAGAANRACTAADLEGSRAPAMIDGYGLSTQEDPFVAGTRYRVTVVRELAIGDRAYPVDSTIAITAPNGPALQQGTEDRRTVYDFTPQQAGTLRLVVSWEARIGSSESEDICAASQAFDLPVLAPTLPDLIARFSRGAGSDGSSFTLRLRGEKPQVPGKVTVILRARRGTTKPPPPRGKALARFTFTPTGNGSFTSSGGSKYFRSTFDASTEGTGVTIHPFGNIPFRRPLLFAFSFEAIQNGKRIGGMRSGARCNRKQFRGFSAVKCRAVGLKSRP